MMYGFEAWTISKQLQKNLEATEIGLLQQADTARSLINKIH